ncbi:MAG: hypothetical protein P8127_05055 [Acidobacteriota bacterium]
MKIGWSLAVIDHPEGDHARNEHDTATAAIETRIDRTAAQLHPRLRQAEIRRVRANSPGREVSEE